MNEFFLLEMLQKLFDQVVVLLHLCLSSLEDLINLLSEKLKVSFAPQLIFSCDESFVFCLVFEGYVI